MPKRASPGNRALIEDALSASMRQALHELQVLLDVDPAGWQLTPLGPPFQTAAVLRRAAELARAGMASSEAVLAAARELGLEPDTLNSRAKRWAKDSRRHNAPDRQDRSAADLVEEATEAPPTTRDAA